jgi:hypothetical protein
MITSITTLPTPFHGSKPGLTQNSSEFYQKPQLEQSLRAVTRSRTKLKCQNKIVVGDLIRHLLNHNVLKSLCEDRKDGNRAIRLDFPVSELTFGNRKTLEIVQTKENVEKVRIKLKT